MEKLVESLFAYIELIVLGAFGMAVAAYGLAVYHPLGRYASDYVRDMMKYWTPVENPSPFLHWLKIGVMIGALYYIGAVANVFSYWLVEPIRLEVLNCVYKVQSADSPCAFGGKGNLFVALGRLQFFHATPDKLGEVNRWYLEDEATVDAPSSNRLEGMLGGVLTFLRLLRGTILFSICLAAVTFLKIALVVFSRRSWLAQAESYERWIDEDRAYLNEAELSGKFSGHPMSDSAKRWYIATRRIFVPQVVILVFGVMLCCVAMTSYRTAEYEYSVLVKDGASLKREQDCLSAKWLLTESTCKTYGLPQPGTLRQDTPDAGFDRPRVVTNPKAASNAQA